MTSSSTAAAVAACVGAFGRLDVLHNNVGIAKLGGPVETPGDDWDRVVAVNQTSMFLTMKHALLVMERQRAGAIVNISSVAALRMSAGRPHVAYSASKAGIIAFSKSVAMAHARQGIRCNAICPGTVESPSLDGRIEALGKTVGGADKARTMFIERQPMGRLGTPEEMAHVAVYLASDESDYMTGSAIVPDGGFTL